MTHTLSSSALATSTPTQSLTRAARNESASRRLRSSGIALAGAAALLMATAPAAMANLAEKFSAGPEKTDVVVDHTAWDGILKRFVKPSASGVNLFDYAGAKQNGLGDIKAYVTSLEGVDPTQLGRNEQFAYWANLYNAKTIEVVVENFPVDSIRKISINEGLFGFLKKSVGAGGPWKAKIITVKGEKLSLDDVEHEIMRKVFKDPRVHYAVNCASIGCPNLRQTAFTGANIDAELDKGAAEFINHPRGIDVKADGSVVASSIYSWFQVDFGGSAQGVIDHALKYAKPELAEKLKGKSSIASFQYDWALNGTNSSS